MILNSIKVKPKIVWLIFKFLYAYAWAFMANCIFAFVFKWEKFLIWENFNLGLASIFVGFVAFSSFYKKLFNDSKLVIVSAVVVMLTAWVILLFAAKLDIKIIEVYLKQTLKDFGVIANAFILLFSLSDIFNTRKEGTSEKEVIDNNNNANV